MRNGRGCQSGFGNECAFEALDRALPVGRNSPQPPPDSLQAEQLGGTAFTTTKLQDEYFRCRQGLKKHFDPRRPG